MKKIALLSCLLGLLGCNQPTDASRERIPDDARVRADVLGHLLKTYDLSLPAETGEVQISCTPVGCDRSVAFHASETGLPVFFIAWPYYSTQGDKVFLDRVDDDLQSRVVGPVVREWFQRLLVSESDEVVTLRVRTFENHPGAWEGLPRSIDALLALDAEQLLRGSAVNLSASLYIYVLADPASYEAEAKRQLQRLLATPAVKQLGLGLDIRWYFRRERLSGSLDVDQIIRNAPNRWLPDTNDGNTRAKWRLVLTGRKFADDLDQTVDSLWPRLERQEPFLTH